MSDQQASGPGKDQEPESSTGQASGSSKAQANSELEELYRRQKETRESLGDLEREIYAYEGTYLRGNPAVGNAVTGYFPPMPKRRKPKNETEEDLVALQANRIFSNSSSSSAAAVIEGIARAKEATKRNTGIKRKDAPL